VSEYQSEVGSQKSEVRFPSSVCPLSSVLCLPSSAFRLLSSVFHLLPSVFCLPSSAFRPLSSVFCPLSSIFYLLHYSITLSTCQLDYHQNIAIILKGGLKSMRYSIFSRDYFKGEKVPFDYPLNLLKSTSFQRRVWREVCKIPYGKTSSYQEIAKRIGSPASARAVGQALRKNPLPLIIPCHRVIRSDGSLGGFSQGIEWKKRLLRLEKSTALR